MHIALCKNARDQQQHCRARKKEATQSALEESKDLLPPQSCRIIRELNRASKVILDAIKDSLSSFQEAVDRQAVM